MKLYHLSQREASGYDTFSDLVVCAESEEDAKKIHPLQWDGADLVELWRNNGGCWCKSPETVRAEYIGDAADHMKRGIVCSSFHAG